MANRNVKSVELCITALPTTINTISETAADYKRFKTEALDIPIPQPEMVSDEGTIGDGVGYAQNVWPYRWMSQSVQLRGKLEDTLFPHLFARVLGGTVVDAAATGIISYNHTIPMATELELVEPKLSSIVIKGYSDFIWGDMYVRSLTITQNRDEMPTFDAELAGTGFHKKISDTTFVIGSVTALSTNYYLPRYHGGATTLVYNNGGAVNLTSTRGLISVTARLTQPCEIISLPGDTFATAGDVESGIYAGTVMRQTQEQDIITLRVYTESTLGQWADLIAGTVLTNVILKFQGKVVGASTDKFETEVKLTRAQITAVAGATEGEYEALDVTIKALPDGSTKRLAIGRVLNSAATLV